MTNDADAAAASRPAQPDQQTGTPPMHSAATDPTDTGNDTAGDPPVRADQDFGPDLDTATPHPARVYNYWLGGKDNFHADRELADTIAGLYPGVRTAAQQNCAFLHRVVTHLARQQGIDQFLDIGTGLPTATNTHQIAQAINPTSRIVYVDNDPMVLAHARALLTSAPEGATAYLDADLRHPPTILTDPALTGTLDLTRPVAVLLIAVLHFIYDSEDPYSIVSQLVDAVPDGSYLAISHATFDHQSGHIADQLAAITTDRQARFQARTRSDVARFVDRFDLQPPGIMSIVDWPTPDNTRPTVEETGVYGVLARIRKSPS